MIPLLDRYIMRHILGSLALVMSVLMALGALFMFIDQQSEIGVGNYAMLDALIFVALNLPQQAHDFMPVGALIGSLLGLGGLAAGSEITVMRAAGLSPLRIAASAAMAGLVLIALEGCLGELLASPLQHVARQEKAFSKYADVSSGGGREAWVRDGNLILNVSRQSGDRQFDGMRVFEITADHHLRAIGYAARAIGGASNGWQLQRYAESRFSDERVTVGASKERRLDSQVSASFFGLAVDAPNDLDLRSLWNIIRYYQTNTLDTGPYLFAFWSRIARTVAILFAVILAVPFVLGSMRSSGSGARTLVGLLLGMGFFLMQRLTESGTFALGLDPTLLAWLPTGLLAAAAGGLLLRAARR